MMLLLSFSRSLPAAGHLSAFVLGSSTCQVPLLLQTAGTGSSSNCCCSWLVTRQHSSCSGVGLTAAGGEHSGNSSSEPSGLSGTTYQFQQACIDAVSPSMHLQLQQRQPALTKQTVSWTHTPQHQGGALRTRAGTLMPCCSSCIRCHAAAPVRAAAGPGAAVPLLQLCRLLLPSGTLPPPQQQQLLVRGLSSRTSDRWRPGGTSNRQRPGGRQHHVLLGQLCAQAESLQQLQQLLHQHADHINGIAVAAAYTRAGKLCQRDAALVQSAAAVELLQHLDQLLPSVQGQLGARELSNIIWSCAYSQHTAPVAQLLPDLVQPDTLSDAKSQEVATVLWALGKMGYQAAQEQLGVLLAAFTAEGRLRIAMPQGIANVLLGMTYMGQQLTDAQLEPLVAAFVSKRSMAKAQNLANFVWAVSEMGQQMEPEQLKPLLAAFEQQLHRASPQAVSNILLACARFRHRPVQLLAALRRQEHMQRFLAAAKPQALSNTAWACGMLAHECELLLGGMLRQAVTLLQQDSSRLVCQNPCNLCWAVAVLNMRQYVSEVLQLAEAASRMWGSAVLDHMRQLYQVHLWLQDHKLAPAEGGKGPGLLQMLSQQQLNECRQAWQGQVAASAAAAPSLLQQQVFKTLQQLPGWQVPPKQEVRTDDSNFSMDIFAVTAAGVSLAVEVDGPYHFVTSW